MLALLAGLCGALQLACASPGGAPSARLPPVDGPEQVRQEPRLRTEPGASVERELGGDVHEFPLHLEAGWFLEVRLRERGSEIEALLTDPGGRIAALASPAGQDHWKLLLAVAPSTGEYRLRVGAQEVARPGGYRLEIRSLRPAAAGDAVRTAARELFAQGQQGVDDANGPEVRCQGLRLLEQALLLFEQAGDADGEVDTLVNMGRASRVGNQAREAQALYGQALERARKSGYRVGEAQILNNLGFLYHNLLKDHDKALDVYALSLALWEQMGDEAEQTLVLLNLGQLQIDRGELEQARQAFERGLNLAAVAREPAREASHWSGIGNVQWRQSDFEGAFRSFTQAFQLSAAAGDVKNMPINASNLAAAFVQLGQLQKAIEFPLEALEEVREPQTRGHVLYNLGGVYLYLGKPEKALAAYEEAAGIFRTLGFRAWTSRALTTSGRVLQLQGDLPGAIAKYEEARALDPEQPIVLHFLGMAHLALGSPERALDFLGESLALAQRLGDQGQQGITRLAMASAYRNLGRPNLAAEQLDLGIDLAGQSSALLAPLLLNRARLRRDTGRLAEALTDIGEAVEIVESTRRNVLGKDLQLSFFASRRAYQELQIDLLMRLDRQHPGESYQARALAASEQARARGLLDLLAEGKLDLGSDISPELAKRDERLAAELSRVQGDLRTEERKAVPDEEKIRSLREDLARLGEERERLEWEIRSLHPKYAQVRYPPPLDLAAIQRELDGRTVLLEYALGEESSFLFVVTREGLEAHELPPAAKIEEQVLRLRETLKREGRRQQGLYVEHAWQLYRDLVAPAARALEGRSRLLIAPDGALALLPFEALLTRPDNSRSYRDLPYLLHRYAIAYVPSASVLAELRQGRRASPPAGERPRFVAFADPKYETAAPGTTPPLRGPAEGTGRRGLPPLPDSRREVDEIARLYPGAARLFLATEANERNVKRSAAVASAERLHFATHGETDEIRPELSALVLSAEDPGAEDGWLQAHEIFRLKLSADLVVLSACETGLGKEVTGEGLVGLARSFLYAGAPALVVSLWSVSDGATPELMVPFYRGLDRLADKAEALRLAKLKMIEGGLHDHPFYWAPFILIGDPGPVDPGL